MSERKWMRPLEPHSDRFLWARGSAGGASMSYGRTALPAEGHVGANRANLWRIRQGERRAELAEFIVSDVLGLPLRVRGSMMTDAESGSQGGCPPQPAL